MGAIACFDGRGSQLVSCNLDQEKHLRVAKIFDPLYYNFGGGFDVAYLADCDYSCEATAYQKICEVKLDGIYTPEYYGSWTFETRFLDGQRRKVRMVLMEHVPYPSIKTLVDNGIAATIPAERRMQALAKTVDTSRGEMLARLLRSEAERLRTA